MHIAHMVAKGLFWVSLSLVLYTYFFYPVLLFGVYSLSQMKRDWRYLVRRVERRAKPLEESQLPHVSLVVAAYNEELVLPAKLRNCGELDYPAGKLELIFVSDGSVDRTNQILAEITDENTRTAVLSERSGKASAINHGAGLAHSDILIFSDAATLFAPNAVRKLVRHFSNPSVGVVCGALQFQATEESRQTEGVYWGYESMLRLMEGRLGATLTASGAIYAIRRNCFSELPKDTILEDLVIPMHARRKGYTVVYDPEAVAIDFAASSVAGEFTRRVRLAVGSFRALKDLLPLPLEGFAYLAFVSHKLLRWAVPFLLISMILGNCFSLSSSFYRASLLAQVAFYLWAAAGYFFASQARQIRFGQLGYFWLAMNIAFLVGFWRFVFSPRGAAWQRVK